MISLGKIDLDACTSDHVKKDSKSLSELLSAPVHRLIQMRRSQMQMVNMLAQSTKCQHGSFEAKYNVFKQMMSNFLSMNEKLQEVIFETFDKDGNEAKKIKQVIKANKKENNTLIEKDSNIKSKNNKKQGKMIDSSIPEKKINMMNIKLKPQHQQKPTAIEQQQKQQLSIMKNKNNQKNKRNRMRTQQQSSENEDQLRQNESNFQQKQQVIKPNKTNTRNKNNWDTMSVVSDNRSISSTRMVSDYYISKRGANVTLEQKIQWVENIIDNKRPIPHFYANFGELLLLPYSILQKLIDYNQSVEYCNEK